MVVGLVRAYRFKILRTQDSEARHPRKGNKCPVSTLARRLCVASNQATEQPHKPVWVVERGGDSRDEHS